MTFASGGAMHIRRASSSLEAGSACASGHGGSSASRIVYSPLIRADLRPRAMEPSAAVWLLNARTEFAIKSTRAESDRRDILGFRIRIDDGSESLSDVSSRVDQ